MRATEWVGFETLAELQAAAPVITIPPHFIVRALVRAVEAHAVVERPLVDSRGKKYWLANLAELLDFAELTTTVAPKTAGGIFRSLKLVMHRRNDGYRVGFSEEQVALLKKAFELK